MYDARWFKDVKEIHLLNDSRTRTRFKFEKADIAVLELEEEIEQEYVKPACFPTKRRAGDYPGRLLVSFRL